MKIKIEYSDDFSRMRDLIMRQWDPIGVKKIPEAADEYDGYVAELLELVSLHTSAQALFEHLWRIETEYMGLPGKEGATRRFAEILSKYNS